MPYSYRSKRTSKPRNFNQKPRNNKSSNRRSTGSTIDPRRFVAKAVVSEAEVYTPIHSFADFKLHEKLQANLTAKGYKTPSPIQDQAIPVGLQGGDVLGMAGTGTGKTAAFALPVLQRLLTDPKSTALIIAPTRELAQQIEMEFQALSRNTGINSALLIGGSGMGLQFRNLRAKPRLIIGTPGRMKDHFERGSLNLNFVNIVVLDEVDRMLDMGFVNDIRTLVNETNPERQSLFFSATMDEPVRRLINDFATEPTTIAIKATAASENVNQDIVEYHDNAHKMDQLHDLLLQREVAKSIIFDETQRGVERLANELVARGFNVESMHGGKSQGQRQRALSKFKKNEVTILVATDVAARGIDVADVTHVINYSIPKEYSDYIHRIGRAGRAGRTGYAHTFVATRPR